MVFYPTNRDLILDLDRFRGERKELLMIRFTKPISCLFLVCFLIAGCGGGKVDMREVSNIDAPEWFINAPRAEDALYSPQTASSRDLQMAVEKAKQQGRADIALQLEAKVKAMVKRFQEEIGLGEDAEFLDMATNVSKSIASTTISGCAADKQVIKQDKNGNYRAYVLMVLPLGSSKTELLNNINSQQNLYTRFRASQSFDELEKEVEEFEEFKKGNF